MDVVGTSLSAAETLFAALKCSELKEILEIIGYESQLEDLKRTVEAVTAVLRDAESKLELSQQTRVLIEELKDAVFEADDLLDEYLTLAQQKQIFKAYGSLSEQFRRFFSPSNPLSVAYRMSRGVKKIKKRLDGIAYNKQFNFEHNSAPLRNRSCRETCSYVNEVDIIGRQDDLDHVVGMLLDDSNVQRDISFCSIVGIGGLGKTALAQLIFNDPRITRAFPLRLWTCVADQDQKQLNVKDILSKVLASATKTNLDQVSTLDQVQSQLREKLADKKYLLVLDDVWTEDLLQWRELVQYLIKRERGHWIVVTTRSQETAKIIGGVRYELPGLSEDNSWYLFEKMAFASDQPNPPQDLVNIGRQIVAGCACVPLAIKVAGSFVYGQEKSKWQSVQNVGMANIRDEKNGIMPILKLSYHHLASPLKSCFSFCALFPKDFRIKKEILIDLWMAQSYIIPLDNGQRIEDAAEEYFSILLSRCFFQDIEKHKSGEVMSCKIHDLMHDIAQSVSMKEIYALNTTTNTGTVGNIKVRHLSVAGPREYGKYPSSKNYIRSHLFVDSTNDCLSFPVKSLLVNCRWLRALDLQRLHIRSLSSSIGELLHLRYLDLSFNIDLVVLPKSVTNLCNLQTLKLCNCYSLKELPKNLNRLVKLRVLDIEGCCELSYMPRGMGELTNLERLIGWYHLGGEGKCSSWKEWFYGLEDLKILTKKLKGEIKIVMRWPNNAKNNNADHWNLRPKIVGPNMKLPNTMVVDFQGHKENDGTVIWLMEELQPHSNLRNLEVQQYNGVKMPDWATMTSLPNLVSLHLQDCEELEYLTLFQSLETLELTYLPKLKGICVEESSNIPQSDQVLPCLSRLHITGCAELTCNLHCPKLEYLVLHFDGVSNDGIRIVASKLREVTINNGSWLNSMPIESFKSIRYLGIQGDNAMEYLPSCIQYMSTLRFLHILYCHNLKSMPSWLPQLTSIGGLAVVNCAKGLQKRCRKDPPGEDWPHILHIPYININ